MTPVTRIDYGCRSFLVSDQDSFLVKDGQLPISSARGLALRSTPERRARNDLLFELRYGKECAFRRSSQRRFSYTLPFPEPRMLSTESVADILYQLCSVAALFDQSLIIHGAAFYFLGQATILAGSVGSGKTTALIMMNKRIGISPVVDDRCVVGFRGDSPVLLNRDLRLTVHDTEGRTRYIGLPTAEGYHVGTSIKNVFVACRVPTLLAACEWLWREIASPIFGTDFLLTDVHGKILGPPPPLQDDGGIRTSTYSLVMKLATCCTLNPLNAFSESRWDLALQLICNSNQ